MLCRVTGSPAWMSSKAPPNLSLHVLWLKSQNLMSVSLWALRGPTWAMKDVGKSSLKKKRSPQITCLRDVRLLSGERSWFWGPAEELSEFSRWILGCNFWWSFLLLSGISKNTSRTLVDENSLCRKVCLKRNRLRALTWPLWFLVPGGCLLCLSFPLKRCPSYPLIRG